MLLPRHLVSTLGLAALSVLLVTAGCSGGTVSQSTPPLDAGTAGDTLPAADSGGEADLPSVPTGPDKPDEPPEPDEPDLVDPPGADGGPVGDGGPGPSDGGPAEPDATPPPPPPPPVPPAQKEVFFTALGSADPDLALEDKLIELLGLTPAGAQVHAALYTFTRGRMAGAFVDAAARGVDIRFVLDGGNVDETGNDNAAVTRLKAGLPGKVTSCTARGSCIGTGINHNKFFLFSELTDGSRQVVVQSSANLTNGQLRRFNNMVVLRDDAGLYQAYRDYWDDLKAQRQNLDYYTSVNGDTGTKAYFFPRQEGDTLVGVLGNVECVSGATVRVAMAFFTDARVEVAQALAATRRAGCTVEALIQETPDANTPGPQVLSILRAGGVKVLVYPEGDGDEGIHSKYTLIDAPYGAGDAHPRQQLIWTGSHNLTGPALRSNDETLLKLDDPTLFQAFTADWVRIRDRATAAGAR